MLLISLITAVYATNKTAMQIAVIKNMEIQESFVNGRVKSSKSKGKIA